MLGVIAVVEREELFITVSFPESTVRETVDYILLALTPEELLITCQNVCRPSRERPAVHKLNRANS